MYFSYYLTMQDYDNVNRIYFSVN